MDALKGREHLVYEMFLIIEQSASGVGQVIDEENVWRSFMEICNARCGTDFQSPDAARVATNRIRESIPIERLEELYEEATGRELNLERPAPSDTNMRDRSPEEVKEALSSLPSDPMPEERDGEDDLGKFVDELTRDWDDDAEHQRRIDWRKGQTRRFSLR